MHLAPAYLTAALMAGPALAQDMAVIERCSTAPIGSEACDGEALAEALGLIDADEVRIFGEAGIESFAVLTALRYGASALFFEAEGEGCYAEEERGAAQEIWEGWVRLPEDASAEVAEKLALYKGVLDNIVTMKAEC